MNWRNKLFWYLDLWKNKSSVSNNVKHLESHFATGYKSRFDREKIQDLIQFSTENIPFYKGFSPNCQLTDLPVVDKSIMRNNSRQFVHQESLNTLKKVSTSGSTGTPFSSYQDSIKIKRNTADTIFFGSLVGYTLGEKLLYIKLWNKANVKSVFNRVKQNIVCIDVTNQSADFIEKTSINAIQSNKGSVHLLAYASYYDQLLHFLAQRNMVLKNIGSAIAMSEGLSLKTKNQLKHYLNVPIYSRYSNVENGIIAQEVPGVENKFLVNSASYFVEILDFDADLPVSSGELGRIVITDIYNRGMPFLRYDTGDVGSMVYDENEGRYFINELHGRKMDLVTDTKGNPVSSLTINNNMLLFPEVRQYQFIQESRADYKFLLNIDDIPYQREVELIDFFKKIFGSDSKIIVEYTKEIPVLSSGKRKQVVNKTLK